MGPLGGGGAATGHTPSSSQVETLIMSGEAGISGTLVTVLEISSLHFRELWTCGAVYLSVTIIMPDAVLGHRDL